ncbi:hypothetical protein BLK45_09860, partial [Campylobacter coli]|nr:hypothetical protein [Campylobacter coli]
MSQKYDILFFFCDILFFRRHNLLKTLTSASEFARIWVAEKDERKKRFIDALDVKPLTQEEIDKFLNK